MKAFQQEFYNSPAWKMTREAYTKSVGGLCELCWEKGIAKPGELVHHKILLTSENYKNPDISLAWDNLQCLCRECHAKVHDAQYERARKRRYDIDVQGRVISREDT